MTVVLDTNILASATYWRGKPAHCLEAWTLGKYDLAISHPVQLGKWRSENSVVGSNPKPTQIVLDQAIYLCGKFGR